MVCWTNVINWSYVDFLHILKQGRQILQFSYFVLLMCQAYFVALIWHLNYLLKDLRQNFWINIKVIIHEHESEKAIFTSGIFQFNPFKGVKFEEKSITAHHGASQKITEEDHWQVKDNHRQVTDSQRVKSQSHHSMNNNFDLSLPISWFQTWLVFFASHHRCLTESHRKSQRHHRQVLWLSVMTSDVYDFSLWCICYMAVIKTKNMYNSF